MALKEILRDFFKKSIVPIASFVFLFAIFQSLIIKDGEIDWVTAWILCGLPFGIRRMFIWLVPHGYDLGATVGIVALNFIIGGIIGGFVLVSRLVRAAWYIPVTIFRIATRKKQISGSEAL